MLGPAMVCPLISLCGLGVSNHYNELKPMLLERACRSTSDRSTLEREAFNGTSPLRKIPFIETEHGGLSESEATFEYIEERDPAHPLYPLTSIRERSAASSSSTASSIPIDSE